MDEQPPDTEVDDSQRSGLRDPVRAIAGLAACVLALEALVLLLTIVPLRMMRIDHLSLAITVVLVLTVACVVLAARATRAWAWHGGTAVQVVLLLCGLLFHWALAGVGLIFGVTWWFALSVRGRLSRPPVRE